MKNGAANPNASILANLAGASLKRIAWAYGCARKGSDEEGLLLDILITRARQEPTPS